MIADRLELARLDYEMRKVRVVFLRDYSRLPTPMGLISVRRGDELELPRWQAIHLKNMGVVEVKDSEVDLNTISTFHYKERRSAQGTPIPLQQDFYLRAGEYLEKIDKIVRENPSLTLLRDRENAEKNIIDISEARLLKLLRLAYTQDANAKTKITVEESVVYDYLLKIVSAWRDYIRRIVGREKSG